MIAELVIKAGEDLIRRDRKGGNVIVPRDREHYLYIKKLIKDLGMVCK